MFFCEICGTRLEDSDNFCPTCGTEVNPNIPEDKLAPSDFLAIKDSMKESSDKAIRGAQVIVEQVGKKVEEKKNSVNVRIEASQKPHKEVLIGNPRSTQYMSSTELWSWLKKKSKRQLFFTEEVSTLEEDEFIHKISQKMEENEVPAQMENRTIRWDRSNIHRRHFFVKPITDAINPLSCVVQFEHIGKFTFVEEKMFITPPSLPDPPMKPLPVDSNARGIGMIVLGIILVLLGCFGLLSFDEGATAALIFLLGGLVLAAVGYAREQAAKEIIEHNRKCMQQEKAWNEAWSNWEKSIFIYSFQEDINGQLSRIFDSVFECIKQVSNVEFSNINCVVQEDDSSMNELEQMIARRKDEYR